MLLVWFAPTILALVKMFLRRGCDNNYLIFKYVYLHAIENINLYIISPSEYYDCNHYGPIFSVIIAPFAMMPDMLGSTLFSLCISASLYIAIYYLPIEWKQKVIIYLISAHSMFASTLSNQTNPLVAALIIAAFTAIHKEKDFWAACFIMLGTFLKLYGIVGLSFFFFSRHKLKFMGSLVVWAVIFFILPMIISSPQFVIQSYFDWYQSLVDKNLENTFSLAQDISVMGMIRRVFNYHELSNFVVLIPALLVFFAQYLKKDLLNNFAYQLSILSSILIFTVIFSTGSESPTFVIAMVGIGIWFAMQKRPFSKTSIFLLIYVFLFSDLARSDLMPSPLRKIIKIYALKALPCFVLWIYLTIQIFRIKQENIKPNSIEIL